MTLAEIKVGQDAVLRTIGGQGELRHHLLDMGLTPGTEVTLRKVAPMGDPIEVELRGYELTLRLDDAAKIDGCSRFMAYFRIYLPLSKPILATLAVLKASQTWNDYLWPLIMVNKDETMTVQLAVVAKFTTEYSIQWNLLMAATALIILPLLVLFIFTQKYFVEGIVTTGMKG